MTEDEFRVLAAEIQARWPYQVYPDATLLVWWSDLRDHDVARVRAAYIEAAADARYNRTPPQSAAIAKQLAGPPPWGQALSEITAELHRIGSYGEPRFSHPAVKAAVDAIGWLEYCMTPEREQPTVRAQMRGVYEAYHGTPWHEVNGELMPVLLNGARGVKRRVGELAKGEFTLPEQLPE